MAKQVEPSSPHAATRRGDARFGSLVGGVVCLDFVNTVRGRVEHDPVTGMPAIVGERLGSYEALIAWSELAELVTTRDAKRLLAEAERRPTRASTVLRRAIALREAIYAAFKAATSDEIGPESALAIINRELHIARAHERLVASRDGFIWSDAAGDDRALERVLWPVVRSATELLTSDRLSRVGQCPGDECGWMFLDTSRSGRRQWCDMRDCGNVAKVRRFRDRR
jgi:predicted RNA-binding Zn ribbon-like protein